MKKKTFFDSVFKAALVGGVMLMVANCATFNEKPKPALIPTERGTVVYQGKYEFKRPPEGWALIRSEEGGDFEMGFLKMEKGDFPSQTSFIYDDQPFGAHQDLEKRAEYYCTRFLFNSGIVLRVTSKERSQIHGQEAMVIHMEGENRNRNEKTKSKIYLIKKGKRIISFVCTQWRPIGAPFSQEAFEHFDTFVQSFKFLEKDFYESFEEELERLGL